MIAPTRHTTRRPAVAGSRQPDPLADLLGLLADTSASAPARSWAARLLARGASGSGGGAIEQVKPGRRPERPRKAR
jgi:hypothetical protein